MASSSTTSWLVAGATLAPPGPTRRRSRRCRMSADASGSGRMSRCADGRTESQRRTKKDGAKNREDDMQTTSQATPAKFGLAVITAVLCAALGTSPSRAQNSDNMSDIIVDPIRGPVDFGLSDPALNGAIDVHLHVDPDAPGTGGVIRAIDAFEAARIAKSRGMRGFVFKTHQDTGSAGIAYMVRKHIDPTFQIFGRMASNYATGGINVAAL